MGRFTSFLRLYLIRSWLRSQAALQTIDTKISKILCTYGHYRITVYILFISLSPNVYVLAFFISETKYRSNASMNIDSEMGNSAIFIFFKTFVHHIAGTKTNNRLSAIFPTWSGNRKSSMQYACHCCKDVQSVHVIRSPCTLKKKYLIQLFLTYLIDNIWDSY